MLPMAIFRFTADIIPPSSEEINHASTTAKSRAAPRHTTGALAEDMKNAGQCLTARMGSSTGFHAEGCTGRGSFRETHPKKVSTSCV